jgi:hypothetical protein
VASKKKLKKKVKKLTAELSDFKYLCSDRTKKLQDVLKKHQALFNDLSRTRLRLDATLYALVLMQHRTRHIENEVCLSSLPTLDEILGEDSLALAT